MAGTSPAMTENRISTPRVSNQEAAPFQQEQRGVSHRAFSRNCRRDHFVSGQPESLAEGNALSPGTTASCL